MRRILFAAIHIRTTLRMSTPLFVGSCLQVTWWALGQWKGRKFYLSDNHHYFSSVDIKICITKRFTWWKQVRFGWQLERISCALCWSLLWLLLLFFCLKIQVKECSLIRFNQMFIITEILLRFSYTPDSNFEISTSRNSSSAVSVREYWQTLVLGSIRVHDSVCKHVTWRPCWWSIK